MSQFSRMLVQIAVAAMTLLCLSLLPCSHCFAGDGPTALLNEPPVVILTADQQTGPAPFSATISSSDSYDPDGYIARFDWSFASGPNYTLVNAETLQVDCDRAGTYEIRVTAVDDRGATAEASITLTVTRPSGYVNQPPVAVLFPDKTSGIAPLSVTIDATTSYDPDGHLVRVNWTITGGPDYRIDEAKVHINFDKPGLYTVTGEVFDNEGASDAAEVQIKVDSPQGTVQPPQPPTVVLPPVQPPPTTPPPAANQPPVPRLRVTPWTGGALGADFDGTGTTNDDAFSLIYELDIDGDGNFEFVENYPPQAGFPLAVAGDYTARFRVTDTYGDSDWAYVTYTVGSAAPADPALARGTAIIGDWDTKHDVFAFGTALPGLFIADRGDQSIVHPFFAPGVIDLGNVKLDDVGEAPVTGYQDEAAPQAGHTYAVRLSPNTDPPQWTYGAFEIVSIEGSPAQYHIRWVYRDDGGVKLAAEVAPPPQPAGTTPPPGEKKKPTWTIRK